MKNTNIITKIVTKTWQRKTEKMPGTKKRRSHYRCNHYHHHRCLYVVITTIIPLIIAITIINITLECKRKSGSQLLFSGSGQDVEEFERPHDPTPARGQEEKERELRGGEKQRRGAIYRCSGLGLDG